MAMPLINPPLKPTDFDALLEEIGLGILPQEEKDAVADKAREMATYSVIRKLRENLDDQQLTELETLWVKAEEDGNYTAVNEFLLKNVPNAEALSDEAVEEVKELIRDSFKDFPKIVKQHVDEYMERREQYNGVRQQQFESMVNNRIDQRAAEKDEAESETQAPDQEHQAAPEKNEEAEPEVFFPWEQDNDTAKQDPTVPLIEAPQAPAPSATQRNQSTESFQGINEELAALDQQPTPPIASNDPDSGSTDDNDAHRNDTSQADMQP